MSWYTRSSGQLAATDWELPIQCIFLLDITDMDTVGSCHFKSKRCHYYFFDRTHLSFQSCCEFRHVRYITRYFRLKRPDELLLRSTVSITSLLETIIDEKQKYLPAKLKYYRGCIDLEYRRWFRKLLDIRSRALS